MEGPSVTDGGARPAQCQFSDGGLSVMCLSSRVGVLRMGSGCSVERRLGERFGEVPVGEVPVTCPIGSWDVPVTCPIGSWDVPVTCPFARSKMCLSHVPACHMSLPHVRSREARCACHMSRSREARCACHMSRSREARCACHMSPCHVRSREAEMCLSHVRFCLMSVSEKRASHDSP